MRSSWNFSTAIFEIWVLVLTKPGWANETPTTSLRVPREYNDYQQQEHHHHNHHHHPNHHYSVAGSTSRDIDATSSSLIRNSNHHHQHHLHHQHPYSSSSFYSSSSNGRYNNNNHYYRSSSHHNGNNNHHHLFDSDSAASALASSSLLSMYAGTPHRCYVCLPPNKNSKEAQQILAIFANELRPLIPDCSKFDPYVDTARFEFDCPPKYGGCLLRIHGPNISRACSKYRVNDCKKANTVEFCYCTTPLCNDKKPEPPIIPAVVHHGNSGNSGGGRSRGGSSSSRTSKSSAVARGTTADEHGGSSSLRTRVSEDDEDILNPPDGENDDDDDDTGSSGDYGDQEQQQSRRHQTFIDPFTGTTMDPTIFQEESSFAVAVEDPNPHTKIGISMTASTSGGSSSSSSSATILGGSFWWWSASPLQRLSSSYNSPCSSSIQGPLSRISTTGRSIFHLFLHLHRLVFIRLFDADAVEQVVVVQEKDHKQQLEPSSFTTDEIIADKDGSVLPGAIHTMSQHHHYRYLCEGNQVAPGEQELQAEEWRSKVNTLHSPEAPTRVVSSPLCFLNSQLCFIISLLLVLKVLSS